MNTTKTKSSVIFACGLALLALPAAFAGDQDPAAADAKFKSMDTDGDGRISRAEHAAGAKKMFDKMDANHDGIVTAAEMDAAHESKAAEHPDASAASTGRLSSAEKIKVIDLNSDGQLTVAEHASGSESMFSKMDTNNDGYLSPAELAAGHKELKKDN